MKHLITASACLVLLLALIMQMVQTQIQYGRILAVEKEAPAFEDILLKENFSEKGKEKVRALAAEAVDCSAEEVRIEIDGNYYTVNFPLKDVIAFPRFWGIDEDEYPIRYSLKGALDGLHNDGEEKGK